MRSWLRRWVGLKISRENNVELTGERSLIVSNCGQQTDWNRPSIGYTVVFTATKGNNFEYLFLKRDVKTFQIGILFPGN